MSKIRRILYFPGLFTLGGVESVIMNIYRNIDKTKFQIDFCVPRNFEGQYDKEVILNGSKIIPIPQISKVGVLRYIRTVKNTIISNGPYDIVHVHSIHNGVYAVLSALLAGVKRRIYHVHNTEDPSLKNMPFSKVYRSFVRALIKIVCTDFIACGGKAAQYVYGSSYVRKGKATILNNGLDLDKFNSRSQIFLKNVKKKYRADIVIGNAARFTDVKNQSFLIEIMAELNKSHTAILLLAGDGENKDRCEKYAKELGIESNIIFMGNISDMPSFYNSLDIFMLPSLHEGLPVSIIEAQACGIPCIISDSVTKECDMGLDLLVDISLKENLEMWIGEIDKQCNKREYDNNKIQEAYRTKDYDIKSNVSTLSKIYSN